MKLQPSPFLPSDLPGLVRQLTTLWRQLVTWSRTLGVESLADGNVPVWNAAKGQYVAGTVGVGSGLLRSINTISTNTTAGTAGDYIYLVTGTTTVTLPSAAANTNVYTVKNVGVATVTLNTTGGATIDGAATQSLASNDALTVASNGTNWSIV